MPWPRRNAGDEYVRGLERRVLAGDLSVVAELARAYESEGRGLAPIHPVLARALEASEDVLVDEANEAGDDARWNVGGNGYVALELVRVAMRYLKGERFDVEAAARHAERDEPTEAVVCRVCHREIDREDANEHPDGGYLCEACWHATPAHPPRPADRRPPGARSHRSSQVISCERCGVRIAAPVEVWVHGDLSRGGQELCEDCWTNASRTRRRRPRRGRRGGR